MKQPEETDDAASMKIHSCFHPNKEIVDLGSFRFLFRLVLASVSISSAALVCAAPTDDTIVSSAQASYVFKTYLKNDGIHARSKHGAVTLTGWVSEASHRVLAQDTMEAVAGVKTVDNQLTVRSETPSAYSDQWLAIKVNSALMFHRNVDADATRVAAVDGAVSLRGKASSLAQKELTGEYAKDVDGVRSVHNEMTVAKDQSKSFETSGQKIDDASITAQIKWSLLSHHSTSAIKTQVHTTDGVVTVSGPARNDAERSLVTKLITDIKGVTRVINNMDAKAHAPSEQEKIL